MYGLYGLRPSFYTRKVDAMLRTMDLPYEFRLKTAADAPRIETAAGGYTRFPVLETPEGEWLTDSTSIGLWLDERHPEAAILPNDPVMRAAALMLDDWIDEWLIRPTIYWRVSDEENRRWVARHAVAGMNGESDPGEDFGPHTDHPGVAMAGDFFRRAGEINRSGGEHEEEVMTLLGRAAGAISAHFDKRPFLLGARVSLPDFALYGMLDAGLLWEPAARRYVEPRWPALADYHERIGKTKAGEGDYDTADSAPETLGDIFAVAGSDFADFLTANAAALASGERDACWGNVAMRARGFTEKCRGATAKALSALDGEERDSLMRLGGMERLTAAYWAQAV